MPTSKSLGGASLTAADALRMPMYLEDLWLRQQRRTQAAKHCTGGLW